MIKLNHSFEADLQQKDTAYHRWVAWAWRRGRDGNKWLSMKVPSTREIRKARTKAQGTTSLGERTHQLLHRFHRLGPTTVLAVIILVLLMVSASILAQAVSFDAVKTEPNQISGVPLAVAEVVGAIVGILIAIIVFAVQFHGERMRDAVSLLKFLVRWEGLFPIAGITFAFITANILSTLIATLWWPDLSAGMIVIDLACILAVMWITLYLFRRLIVSISTNFFRNSVLPGLVFEFNRFLDDKSYVTAMRLQFIGKSNEKHKHSELAAMDVEWSPYASESSGLDYIGIGPKFNGVFTDVSLPSLYKAVKILQHHCPGWNIAISRSLGDCFDDSEILWIKHSDPQPSNISSVLSEIEPRINKCLQRAIRCGRKKIQEWPGVIDDLLAPTIKRALAGNASDTEKLTQILLEMHRVRLSRPDRHRLDCDEISFESFFVVKESVYKIVHAAADSGDIETVDTICSFVIKLAALAMQYDQLALFQRSISMIGVLYSCSVENDKNLSAIASRIDTWTDSLCHIDLYRSAVHQLSTTKQEAFNSVVVREITELVRAALTAKRERDAENFLEHMRLFVERGPLRGDRSPNHVMVRRYLYATTILAGWCLKLMERDILSSTEVGAFLKTLVSQSSKLNHSSSWLNAWEQEHRGKRGSFFDLDRWGDSFRTMRPGIPYAGNVSTEWAFDGLIALMLMNPKSNQRFDDKIPSRDADAEATVEAAINRVAHDSNRGADILGLDELELPGVSDAVRKNFAMRRLVKRRDDLRLAISPPLNQHLIDSNCKAVRLIFQQLRADWLPVLDESSTTAKLVKVPPYRYPVKSIRKDYVGETGEIKSDGTYMTPELVNFESQQCAGLLESYAMIIHTVVEMSEISSAIRDAKQQLSNQGYRADTVLIPQQPRFARVLFTQPTWQRNSRRQGETDHEGVWENLDVFLFPYTNPKTILVFDSTKCWGSHHMDRPVIDLDVTEPDKAKHEQLLADAEEEIDDAKIPDAYSIAVREEWKLFPRYGIADGNAVRAISIDLSKLGYALSREDALYHRPDCSALSTIDKYSLAARLEEEHDERPSCDKCDPYSWDHRDDD